MPHSRKRHILRNLVQRLKFAPVVAIQGPRQSGKSFLVRELLVREFPKAEYLSFDQKRVRDRAEEAPDLFLEAHHGGKPLIMDEAQKAPSIFDAIKFQVDQKRIPGKYLILGSTEFSHLTRVKESLTGRMSRVRLFTLNAAEALQLVENPKLTGLGLNPIPRIKQAQVLQHLDCGGFPGLFHLRNQSEFQQQMKDWINLTLSRDLFQFVKVKPDATIAHEILSLIATEEFPEAGRIAKKMKKDLRRIATHLHLLESLFVIHAVHPHALGTGKTIYFLCDPSLVAIFGGGLERSLHTWVIHERLSQNWYRFGEAPKIHYFRSAKGGLLHLVEETQNGDIFGLQLFTGESVRDSDLKRLHSFRERFPNAQKKSIKLVGLYAGAESERRDGVMLHPWGSLV